MNGLHLHTGNRLETLAGELAEVLSQPEAFDIAGVSDVSGDPAFDPVFSPEIVLVQSLGMSRWVSLQIAERLGICMNCEFPFPQAFLDRTLRQLVPEMAPRELFSVERMTWRIYHLLAALLPRAEFAPVRRFLADGDAIKRYQLAQRVANLFDQYLVYRPAMILDWERARSAKSAEGEHSSGDAAWQSILWREVNSGRHLHFAAALERLSTLAIPPGRRLSIFGVSSLPPAHMEVLFHLAGTRPVHLFLLAPSREYHGDDLTPRQRARRGLPQDADSGHPLLASLGRLNAHFTELLLEADERAGHRIASESDRFETPHNSHSSQSSGASEARESETRLARLQADILHARPPGEVPPPPGGFEGDDSIILHVCHSPMREVEVLYDQLLALLEADPGLAPRDILVMAPDIETYAPFIHAVFGYPENPALRIPYSVADRHPRAESHFVDVFLRLLELPGTRCTARQIFSLLESEPLRRRFDFTDGDLHRIREWIDASGIRWALDGAHREAFGVPPVAETTWRYGLDRLLLGYAMTGGNRETFEGILPLDDMETGSADLLGRLAGALEAIEQTLAEAQAERTLPGWSAWLGHVLERFFVADDRAEESAALQRMRLAFEQLAAPVGESGGNDPVPFEAVREHLAGTLGADEHGRRFLTGGVTFCALKPMRSIPARVIWLLGMDEGAFPRKPQPLQFDLMARHWKLGDRSVRDDDRYLFLEALISARERLVISYVGRSERNNQPIAPSIVVSELLDALAASSPGENLRDCLTVEHPLQAFSPRYFGAVGAAAGAMNEPRLFTYSAANAEASPLPGRKRPTLEPPFAPEPLPEPEAGERVLSLDRLAEFLACPAAFFLKQRLGMHLREEDNELEENEPSRVDSLAAYHLKAELLEAVLKGQPEPEARAFAARALVPPGSVGERYTAKFGHETRAFHRRVAPHLGAPEEPLSGTLELGGFTLNYRIDSIYAGRVVHFRLASLKPKDYLRLWVRHLAFCALRESADCPARLIGSDEEVEFAVPEQPGDLLTALLELYWQGLRRPLPFFPAAARAYAKAAANPRYAGDPFRPLQEARKAWGGSDFKEGESSELAYRICFPGGGNAALDAEFESLAQAVFVPMLAVESVPSRMEAGV